jgi:hypothetical protein
MEIRDAVSQAERAGDRQKLLCIKAVVSILLHGRPMTSYPQTGQLMQISKHPDYGQGNHWTEWSGWQIVEAVDAVVVQKMKAILRQCNFFSLSCDESTDNSLQN